MLTEAERMNLPLVGTAVVNQLLRSVQAYGGDEQGTQALITAVERMANLELVPKEKKR